MRPHPEGPIISNVVPALHVAIDGGPSITDWMTAWATVATPVVAVVAIWPVWRQLRILVTDKEREQAAHFAMWTEYSAKSKGMEVLYANGGTLPVYDVRGTIVVGDGKRPTRFERGTIGPTAEPVPDRVISQLVNGEIGTCLREKFGDRVDRTNAYGDSAPPADVVLGRSELAKSVQVSLSFRDAAGIAWRRTADGRLTKESRKNPFQRKLAVPPANRQQLPATYTLLAPLATIPCPVGGDAGLVSL